MVIGDVVAFGGDASPPAAVVVDVHADGTAARLVYRREDGAYLAGRWDVGWETADAEESALYGAADLSGA